LDDNYVPVQPIQQFLRYFNNIERSPNTIRTYAYHLKLFWEFLSLSHFEWEAVGLTEMPDFIHWLRDPQPVGTVAIHNRIAKRTESSVNAILSSVAMFYDYHYRLETIPNSLLYKQYVPLPTEAKHGWIVQTENNEKLIANLEKIIASLEEANDGTSA
jgi:site-specific recombinase XerD